MIMEMIGKNDYRIKHATDYTKFAILPMNRGIDSRHVQKMITSIRQMGVVRCVITCTTDIIEGVMKTYIIDGQHLATALERESQPIPYVDISIESEEDLISKMALLNNSSKSWDLMNYINAWKMIRPDYMKLFKWKNMYDLEISMVACIATKMPSIRYGTQPIKNGTFNVTNPDAETMCKAFNDIFLKIGMVERNVKFQFLSAFMLAFNDSYNHQQVIDAVDKNMKTIKLMANGDETGAFIRKQIFKLTK
jgi:hypothetical protein